MMTYSPLRYSYPFTISLRSTTRSSCGHQSCCLIRVLSSRCSMWKEMWLPRAPENRRTGMEINPNVKYPDHTEDAISRPFLASLYSRDGARTETRIAAKVG